MVRVMSEPTPDGHDALSEDAVGMHVLGRKSGYVRGMGHGPKPPPVRNIHCSGCVGSRSREVQLQQQLENFTQKIEQMEVERNVLSNKIQDMEAERNILSRKVQDMEAERNVLSSKIQYMEAKFSSKVKDVEAQQAQLLRMFEEFRSTRTSST